MKKITIFVVMMFAMITMMSLASAFTITNNVDFQTQDATYRQVGTTSSIELMTVNEHNITFNAYGREPITFSGTADVMWNYDESAKNLMVQVGVGTLTVTGTDALLSSSTYAYEIYDGSNVIDDEVRTTSYEFSTTGTRYLRADSVVTDLGDATLGYDTNAFQTERVSWNLSMSDSIASQMYEMVLVDTYDNEYNSTYEVVGDQRLYTAELNVPLETSVETNVSFWWKGSLYVGGSVESDRFNVSVKPINMNIQTGGSCPTNYTSGSNAIVFSFVRENGGIFSYPDNTYINMTNLSSPIEVELNYWYGDDGGQVKITENWDVEPFLISDTTTIFCVLDNGAGTSQYHFDLYAKVDVPVDSLINYNIGSIVETVQTCDGSNCTSNTTTTYDYLDQSFTQRFYRLDFNGDDFYSYLLMDTEGYSTREIQVYDSSTGARLDNLFVQLERYYVDTGDWLTVQTDKTDVNGNALFYVKDLVADYRFVFANEDGVVYETTSVMKFNCNNGVCRTIFYTDPSSVAFDERPVVNSDILYTNTSSIVDSKWFVDDGRELSVTTKVTKTTATGEKYNICEETTYGSSDSHLCDISGHIGNIDISVTSDYEDVFKLENHQIIQAEPQGLGSVIDFEDAVFWSFIIMVIIIFAGLFAGPATVVIMTIISMFIITWLGMLNGVSGAFMVVALVLGVIVATKVEK